MSLKIYVVRHGQSVANISEYFHDDSTDELTMAGKMQAMDAGYKIKHIKETEKVDFDAIYCSPYERARATCAIALEAAGMKRRKVHYDERLRERDLDGLHGKKFDRELWIALQNFNSDLAEKEGIETYDVLENRAQSFIEDVKTKYPNGNVLVFSHGLMELAIYTTQYGRPVTGSTYDLRLLKNGEMRIYTIK